MPPRLTTLLACLLGACGTRAADAGKTLPAQPGRIVAVHHPATVSAFRIADTAFAPMLEAALTRLTGRPTLPAALASLVSPQDVVAIHVNVRGIPPLATHPALVKALVDGLLKTGLPPGNIIIWGRSDSEMTVANYPLQTSASAVRTLAVIPTTGFDRDVFYFNENIGELIWGDLEFAGARPDLDQLIERASRDEPIDTPPPDKRPRQSSPKSYFANIVTRMATKIINAAVMSNSESTGLHGCLASLAMDSVDNNRRFEMEPLFGDPAIAEICAEDALRAKTVLHLMDGTIAQYAGGPNFSVNYCNEHATLYASFDPVAIDATAARLMEKWRSTRRLPELAPILGHIRSAARLGLGVAHSTRVRVESIALSQAPPPPAAPPVE